MDEARNYGETDIARALVAARQHPGGWIYMLGVGM